MEAVNRRFDFVENPTSVDRRYCFSLHYFPVDKRQQIHQQFPFVRSERKKKKKKKQNVHSRLQHSNLTYNHCHHYYHLPFLSRTVTLVSLPLKIIFSNNCRCRLF